MNGDIGTVDVILALIGIAVVGRYELEAWRTRRALAVERAYWQSQNEKLMNRIQEPISEVARSQQDHDGVIHEPWVAEERTLNEAEVDAELAKRGIDLSRYIGE